MLILCIHIYLSMCVIGTACIYIYMCVCVCLQGSFYGLCMTMLCIYMYSVCFYCIYTVQCLIGKVCACTVMYVHVVVHVVYGVFPVA